MVWLLSRCFRDGRAEVMVEPASVDQRSAVGREHHARLSRAGSVDNSGRCNSSARFPLRLNNTFRRTFTSRFAHHRTAPTASTPTVWRPLLLLALRDLDVGGRA